jgi:hypothetical protein
MPSTSDIFYSSKTRESNGSIFLVRDVEMGLLHNPHQVQADEDEVDTSPQIPPLGAAEQRHNSHEVIGDALELFSKHLRAHK